MLKPGKDKKIRNRYPWVQKEEVKHMDPAEAGQLARLITHDGQLLGTGFINSGSRFPFRMLSLDHIEPNSDFFVERFRRAAKRREGIADTDSMRLVFAEADELPGLIVDRFRNVLVVQVRAAGMERLRDHWLPALKEIFQPDAIYERSDMEGRREEGLEPVAGLLYGSLPDPVLIEESGLTMAVPVESGLKTGYYLDQRETRRRLASRVAAGQRVLDTFCYSGAFSLYAARQGAHTLGVDLNPVALDTARQNAELNQLPCTFVEANVFEWLESGAGGEPPFDWIVLDPPAIAKSSDKRDSLKWAIWNLVFHSLPVLADGGRMVVCSCSYQLGLNEMLDTIRMAATDQGWLAYLEEVTYQGTDHPYLLQFPESLYLKCAWVRFERC
jgi:23S rRNA (cytosine1962-C5)-methyltransferase